MAVTEQIKSAIYRVYNSTSSIWNRYSFWNKASSCEFDDGETAEAKLGKIKGITTSLAATETGYAADATAVKTLNDSLNDQITGLNNTFLAVSNNYWFPINSERVINITSLINTGSNYTSDKNGFIYVKVPANSGSYIGIVNTTLNIQFNKAATSNTILSIFCPIGKNQSFYVYTDGKIDDARIFY